MCQFPRLITKDNNWFEREVVGGDFFVCLRGARQGEAI